jgi:hypothetical protein
LGVGLGVTGFVVAGGAYDDAESSASRCGPAGTLCSAAQSSLDDGNTMRGIGIGGFALGGAALTGMVVYLVWPESASPSTGLRFAPQFGATNGISLGGTF